MLIGNQPESNKENDHFEKYLPSHKVEVRISSHHKACLSLSLACNLPKNTATKFYISLYFINHWIRIVYRSSTGAFANKDKGEEIYNGLFEG